MKTTLNTPAHEADGIKVEWIKVGNIVNSGVYNSNTNPQILKWLLRYQNILRA